MSTRKIPRQVENPIDNVLYDLADVVSPAFYRTGHVPNVITTYSLVTYLCALWSLWQDRTYVFVCLWTAGYFLDCLDGHYARKYDMVTKTGDYYDHFKDVLCYILLFVVAWKKYPDIPAWLVLSLLCAFFLTFAHMGCQQHYYTSRPYKGMAETLDTLKPLCPVPENIDRTKYFGLGTTVLVLLLVILWSIGKAPVYMNFQIS